MKQSNPPTVRRCAAFGATVALVAVSSVIGIGSTAAVADTSDVGASTSNNTSSSTGTGSGSAGSAPTTVVEPAAPVTDAATAPPAPAPASPTPIADPADGTDATAAPVPAPAPTPTAEAPADGTDATADAAPAADSSVTWDQPSTPSNRIVWTVTAGTDFSHRFVAHGGDGPLEYGFNPAGGIDVGGGFTWSDDGLFHGTPTSVGTYDYDVLATDTRNTATQWIRIEVVPAAAKSIAAEVYSGPQGEMPAWGVSAAGVAPVGGGGLIDAVPVQPGASRWMDAVVVDEFGNPLNGPETASESTVTSSAPEDTLVYDDTRNLWKVSFSGAGPRSLTMTSEGLTLTIPVMVEGTELAFTGTGSSDEFRTTAGVPFTHTYATAGSISQVRYVLQYPDGEYVDPEHADARIPDHLAIDRTTGVLSGTPTVAGDYRFVVVATDGSQVARRDVHMVVSPGATTHLQTFMSADPQMLSDVTYGYGPGDQLIRIDGIGEGATHTAIDSIPVRQGGSLYVKTTPMDNWGNATVPMEPAPGDPSPTVTSSVGSDEVSFLPEVWSTKIRFPHASVHTISVSLLGASSTFDVSVTPVASGSSDGGALAYTGADESAPLAWAFGLLAAGGGLLLHRVRRRRG